MYAAAFAGDEGEDDLQELDTSDNSLMHILLRR
jgi:hypothetical protein